MTKKHFEAIARIIFVSNTTRYQRKVLAIDFSNYLKTENPRFNSERFIKAAVYGDHTINS